MGTNWVRNAAASLSTPVGTIFLASVPAGQTIMRVRFGWGFHGDQPAAESIIASANNLMILGLVTTIGNGTEPVPDPHVTPGDVAPPTQRWLWWEARQPVVSAISEGAGVTTFRDSGAQELTDARGQVLATGIPVGDTLNLWASWSFSYGWADLGSLVVWCGASVLLKT